MLSFTSFVFLNRMGNSQKTESSLFAHRYGDAFSKFMQIPFGPCPFLLTKYLTCVFSTKTKTDGFICSMRANETILKLVKCKFCADFMILLIPNGLQMKTRTYLCEAQSQNSNLLNCLENMFQIEIEIGRSNSGK